MYDPRCRQIPIQYGRTANYLAMLSGDINANDATPLINYNYFLDTLCSIPWCPFIYNLLGQALMGPTRWHHQENSNVT
jgi:hypothetical protein